MATDHDGRARLAPLSGAIYLTAFLLIVISMIDFISAVVPIRLGEAGWRYGAVGLFAGFMLTPLLGCLIGVGFAVNQGHRTTARVLSIATLAVTVLMVLTLVSFSLDALQMRREAAAESQGVIDVGVIRAAVKHVAGIIAFGLIGLGGLSASRRPLRARSDDPDLVVGRPR